MGKRESKQREEDCVVFIQSAFEIQNKPRDLLCVHDLEVMIYKFCKLSLSWIIGLSVSM